MSIFALLFHGSKQLSNFFEQIIDVLMWKDCKVKSYERKDQYFESESFIVIVPNDNKHFLCLQRQQKSNKTVIPHVKLQRKVIH